MFFVRVVTNRCFRRTVLISLAVFLAACSSSSDVAEDARVDVDWGDIALSTGPKISWADDVQPVLEKRCVVCHGCFDAPCQLKLTSYEGLVRGANSTCGDNLLEVHTFAGSTASNGISFTVAVM